MFVLNQAITSLQAYIPTPVPSTPPVLPPSGGFTGTLIWILVTLFLVTGLIIAGFVLQYQRKIWKMVDGKAFCTVLYPEGVRKDDLFPVLDGWIVQKIKIKEGEKDTEIRYRVKPQYSYKFWYPIGRPRIVQANINSYILEFKNPNPLCPHQKTPVLDGELVSYLFNTTFGRALVARSQELTEEQLAWADQLGVSQKMKKKSKWTTIIIVGSVVFLILGGVFVYFYLQASKHTPVPVSEIINLLKGLV